MPYFPEQVPPVDSAEELARYTLRELERIAQASDEGGLVTIASTAEMIAGTNNTKVVSPLRFLEGLQQTPWTGLGAGAVARTFPQRADDILNINDFGAVGDGSDANGTANLNAFNAAKARCLARPSGGLIYVPPGNYVTAGEWLIPDSGSLFSKITLIGGGQYISTVKARTTGFAGVAVIRIQGQTHVEGLRIHGNGLAIDGIRAEGNEFTQPITLARLNILLCQGYAGRFLGPQVFVSDVNAGVCNSGFYNEGPGDGSVYDRVIVQQLTGVAGAERYCWSVGRTGTFDDGIEDFTLRKCAALPNPGPGVNRGVLISNGNLFTIDNCVLEGPGTTTGRSLEVNGPNPSNLNVTNTWLGSGMRINGGMNHLNLTSCMFPGGAGFGASPVGGPTLNAGRTGFSFHGNRFYETTALGHRINLDEVSFAFFFGNSILGNNRGVFMNNTVGVVFCGNAIHEAASSPGGIWVTGTNF